MTPALYIDLSGAVVAVDPARAAEVENLGYIPASAEQARDHFLREKHGTTGQAALAGLESFGSMLTLGASTWAEKAAGVDPEGIAARERLNPVASGVGAGAGILAPLLLSGGADAPLAAEAMTARAARMAGPSLLARAGKAVSKAALRELPEGAPLAQRLAARGLSAAAGGAVEGAGYEVGQLVHEAALGDPSLMAESALARVRVGMSAATFGVLSGGGSVLGLLAKEAAGGLGEVGVGAKLEGWLKEFEGERGLKAAGGIQSDFARARKQIGRTELNAIGREIGELGLVSPLSTPAQTLERADALMGRAGATMGEVLASADEVAAAEGAKLGNFPALLQRARAEILRPLERDVLQREAASKLAADLEAFAKAMPKDATLAELHGVRRSIDTALYGMRGTMDPYASAYKSALHDFRSLVSDGIAAGVEKSGVPLDLWKVANREYQVAAKAAEFAERGMDRAAGNNLVSPTELLSGLAGGVGAGIPGGVASGLVTAAVRRHGSGTLNWMARGLRGLLEGPDGALVANGTAAALAEERRMAYHAAHAQGLAAAFGQPISARAAGLTALAGSTLFSGVSAAPETAVALAVLAQAKRAVTEEIDGALTRLLKGVPGAAGRAGAAAASRRSAEEVKHLAAEPGALEEALTRQADDMSPHAPGVAQAMQMATARSMAFLATKAPRASLPGVQTQRARPNAFELSKFARYAEVAHRPLRALEHARRGTLTPEHVESLQMGWPALHAYIQERALEALAAQWGKTIHPQSRMMFAMLTSLQLDGALGWNSIAANQAVYAHAVGSPADRPVPNPNAGALKQAGRVQTQTQRLNGRLGQGD